MLVYVINGHGKPLMPCKPGKVRKLLEYGKAKVVQRIPCAIQLLYGSSGCKQPITLKAESAKTFLIERMERRVLPSLIEEVPAARI